jgi:hypothetical protein
MQTMPRKSLLVLLPQPPLEADSANRSDHERFIREFKEAVKGAVEGDVQIDFAESSSPREITIIALNYWMAARFAACMKKLKERYDEKISGNTDSAASYRYFCHLHDNYSMTPDLFPAPGDALRLSFKAFILIGEYFEIIETAETGEIYLIKEKDGLPFPEEIAASSAALEALTDVFMIQHRATIRQNAALRTNEDFKGLLDSEREKLRKCLIEECANKSTNPLYLKALANFEALKKAVEEIKGVI